MSLRSHSAGTLGLRRFPKLSVLDPPRSRHRPLSLRLSVQSVVDGVGDTTGLVSGGETPGLRVETPEILGDPGASSPTSELLVRVGRPGGSSRIMTGRGRVVGGRVIGVDTFEVWSWDSGRRRSFL